MTHCSVSAYVHKAQVTIQKLPSYAEVKLYCRSRWLLEMTYFTSCVESGSHLHLTCPNCLAAIDSCGSEANALNGGNTKIALHVFGCVGWKKTPRKSPHSTQFFLLILILPFKFIKLLHDGNAGTKFLRIVANVKDKTD